jgi:hypothetical protein
VRRLESVQVKKTFDTAGFLARIAREFKTLLFLKKEAKDA